MIIMFHGRNYRQPKNLTPINTLTKKKALFKARFEQALQSQKLNIKKDEQELRKMGIEPADSALISSEQRIAATFFSAIDKKEANQDSQRTVELFDASIDSDQEELDKFIAEIEGAVDKEWAEEEAAEKEELGKIRYRNREEFGGRFRRPELYTGCDESRGWKDSNRKQIASDSDDEDDLPEDTNGWESEDEDPRHEIGAEANDSRSMRKS
ncbi:CRM-domain containing factor CFM9, mitochondrial-like protein [Drosera capensis]